MCMLFWFTAILGVLAGLDVETVVGRTAAAQTEVVVFAAASTTNAVTEIGDLFAARKLGTVTTSFASSSTLAKQIASGAPADVYLSANKKWMDFLEEKNFIDKATRVDLLGNRIVLIAPSKSSIQALEVNGKLDLAALLGSEGRLSMGDPDHVPAGMYGKKAMESLNLWDKVKDRLAPMKDVRAALVLVERAEAPLGQVYATDAAISNKVRVVGLFPLDSHPPIVYPVAAVAGGKISGAKLFLEFLRSQEARAIFEKYGFNVR
ncbi:MAG: molybdate ABC transporter substrate-binding protein [Deltaproteobacteria bacterium]|nr:molybdate ABC transporter substrate-binding protein [Deltaproteobacteria bacterium]